MPRKPMDNPYIVDHARQIYRNLVDMGDRPERALSKSAYIALRDKWRKIPIDMTNYANRIRYGEQYEALLAAIQEPQT